MSRINAADAFLKGTKLPKEDTPIKSKGWIKTHEIYERAKKEVAILNSLLAEVGTGFSLEVKLDDGHSGNGVVAIRLNSDSELEQDLPMDICTFQPNHFSLEYGRYAEIRGDTYREFHLDNGKELSEDLVAKIIGRHTRYIAMRVPTSSIYNPTLAGEYSPAEP